MSLPSPAAAMARGVATIHQELHLCDNLSIAANLFLGREPLRWRRLGWIDRARRDDEAGRALAEVGLEHSPATPVAALGPAGRQLVEVARALAMDARFVIMDEPTSSLDRRHGERLLELVSTLRDRGIGVLYVSHRLEEVTRIADRAVVLRDGRVAGELRHGEIDASALVRHMVGRDVGAAQRAVTTGAARLAGEVVLAARGLRVAPASPAIDFELHAGEVLGLFGVVGAGRTELLETLFGLRRPAAGEIEASPGLALVPEDRKAQGLVAEMTVAENLALARLARRPLLAWRDRGEEGRRAAALCARLDIRPPRPGLEVLRLSGGNQQKVVLGKWLAVEPRVLLLDEPTRGVDVGARAEIHRRLRELAASGVAILLSSAETEEILALADRVLVLRRGAVAGSLESGELSEESLLRLATA